MCFQEFAYIWSKEKKNDVSSLKFLQLVELSCDFV